MSWITKTRLRITAGMSFLITLIVGWLGTQRSMMAYGTPEMMANNPDPFGAGKLMLAALIFLIVALATFILSFFKKE